VPDTALLDAARKDEFRDRGVILFGHAESNAAWSLLVGESPVQVVRGKVLVEGREIAGDDLACLFVRPRPGSDSACIGVVGGTGMPGLKLTERLPYFVSGVAYPDFAVFSAKDLQQGGSGLKAAGYFGVDWTVKSGEFAWQDSTHPERKPIRSDRLSAVQSLAR
jgi:hypothetical protein